MIQMPENLKTTSKKIRLLIYGQPGIGKSSVALSAPRPLLVDCDHGIDRVSAVHRKPFIQPNSYQEVLDDLTPDNLTDFDTIVFDTAGKLITLMSQWAIKRDPKYGQRDGSLSLKGYGYVGREFVRLMDYCYYTLQKHIIVLFHATEDKDGDNTKLRLKVEGQTKNNVWEPMDLGGCMEMNGNDRTIFFGNSPDGRTIGKGTRGINGLMIVPDLATHQNDFLTKLFDLYNTKAEEEIEQANDLKQKYEEVMEKGHAIIDSVVDAATANEAAKEMAKLKHALTSEAEIKAEWVKKTKEKGLVYDKKSKLYTEVSA